MRKQTQSGNCNVSCMPKSEIVVKCCQQLSRSATNCDGDNLWPTALTFAAVSFLSFFIFLVFWRWWCRWHLPWIIYIYCINSMFYLWILLRHCYWRESGYCVCVCVIFVTFLEHFRLSEGLAHWLIDWSNHLGKVRREKGLAKFWVYCFVANMTYAQYICMFSRRLCRGSLCNLLINHTQRCLPTHTLTHTLALHSSWRTHTHFCVSARSTNLRIDKQTEWRDMTRRRTNKYNANGSKTKSMRRWDERVDLVPCGNYL